MFYIERRLWLDVRLGERMTGTTQLNFTSSLQCLRSQRSSLCLSLGSVIEDFRLHRRRRSRRSRECRSISDPFHPCSTAPDSVPAPHSHTGSCSAPRRSSSRRWRASQCPIPKLWMCSSRFLCSSAELMLARCIPWNLQYCSALYQLALKNIPR